jgi:hybrid cluster-associated redox disulfide protein
MEQPDLSARTIVADVLAFSPRMAPLFVELRLDCVGCSMNRFCSLADLCRDYAMDLNTLLAAIRERLASASGQ